MTELWERFSLEPVERVPALDRGAFAESYQGRRPVIVSGGLKDSPAVVRWDPDYLAARAGDAEVSVAAYPRDHRDFGSVEVRRTTFRDFLHGLTNGHGAEVTYLFNNATCVFARNEEVPAYHLGSAARPNPGLAPLAADLQLPRFVAPEDFVLAVLIVGSDENATDLHYDFGGEAKVLLQIRGRKRILLLPPDAATELAPYSLLPRPGTPPGQTGSRPSLDVHAEVVDGAASRDLHGYSAEIGPGDAIYWPPFWFHDVANLDPVTIAAGVFVDEVRLSPLLLRYLSSGVARLLAAAAVRRTSQGASTSDALMSSLVWDMDVSLGGERVGTLGDLFAELEQHLLSDEMRRVRGLWETNHRFWTL